MDQFASHAKSLISPYTNTFVVTPSDGVDLPEDTRGVICETSGVLGIVTIDGNVTTIPVAGGVALPLRLRRIRQTGTTVTGQINGLV